jgi:hypothetical protein
MDEATKWNRKHTLNQMKLAAEVFQSLAKQVGDEHFTALASEAVKWASECEAVFKAGRDYKDQAVASEMADACR